ncbi:MAG: DUF4157 domain-containing protein [Spirochaetales bacterium]|nr:DUF4157 domain-containing protein [Spirochaetales bacterium]
MKKKYKNINKKLDKMKKTHFRKSKLNHSPSPPDSDMTLQKMVGNQEVKKMFEQELIQARLYLNNAMDNYELEADKIADQVVSVKESTIKNIQKKNTGKNIKAEQIKAKNTTFKSSGQPLQKHIRDYYEPRFGVDLGNVNVHSDSNADRLAKAINARAFTLGNDIFFAKGEYSPETGKGKKLIAHELTHVLQQGKERNNTIIQRKEDNISIFNKLGNGNPLDRQVQQRMDSVFHTDFSHIRIHTNNDAGLFTSHLRAKTFTIGDHIVFNKEDYKPGTIAGDALLAHELAHTIQQKDALQSSKREFSPNTIQHAVAEKSADNTAFSVVKKMWYRSQTHLQNVIPEIKTGLSLRGCSRNVDVQSLVTSHMQAHPHLQSPRFKKNDILEEVYTGTRSISLNESGIHVTIIQQALVDAGFLSSTEVTGTFHNVTQTALRNFLRSQRIPNQYISNTVDNIAMILLDEHFLYLTPEFLVSSGMNPSIAPTPGIEWPTGMAPPELLRGTRNLTRAEIDAINLAITTEPRTSTGTIPVFNETIATHPQSYGERVEDELGSEISWYSSYVANLPDRTNPNNLIDTGIIDTIARKAKEATDNVFGDYRVGPQLAYNVNIFDQYIARESFINTSQRHEDNAVNFRVLKILNDDEEMKEIHRQHGAVITRPPEWTIIANVTGFPVSPPLTESLNNTNPPHVTTGLVGTNRNVFIEMHKNWPASAGGGRIYIQRYKASTDERNRDLMYQMFGTFIHEYIHTLEHSNHIRYRESLQTLQGGFVLREGIVDYFSRMVWDNIKFNRSLRRVIEGPFHDSSNPTGHTIKPPPRYGVRVEAEHMVGIAGIRNTLAAFFLGQVYLIGGPPP